MAQMIVAFLGTAAWVGGVLVFVVMAALPVLGPLVAVAALVCHPARSGWLQVRGRLRAGDHDRGLRLDASAVGRIAHLHVIGLTERK